jgi:hypothetical protein
VLIKRLTFGLTTAVLTSRRSGTGCGSHIVADRVNGVVISGKLGVAPYTVCSNIVRAINLAKRINYVFLLGIACLTGYYSTFNVSANGTGGRSLTGSVAHSVTESGNGNSVTSELVAAGSTVNYFVIRTVSGTGRSYVVLYNRSRLNVAEYGNSRGLGGNATYGTNLMLSALFVTGSLEIYDPVRLGVAESGKRFGVKKCTADGTFLMLATKIGTVGLCIYDPIGCGVTGSGNDLLRKSGNATNGTYKTVGQTVLSTRSRITGNSLLGVAECRTVGSLTQSTSLGSQAGCIFPNVLEGLALYSITVCAVLSAVARCGDPEVSLCLTAGSTAKSTGSGGLTVCAYPVMVKCSTLGCVTEGTYLGRATGGVRPSMGELFTFGSSAGTSLRCLTGSLHPVVHMLRLRLFTKERWEHIARSKCHQKDQ